MGVKGAPAHGAPRAREAYDCCEHNDYDDSCGDTKNLSFSLFDDAASALSRRARARSVIEFAMSQEHNQRATAITMIVTRAVI